VLITDFFPYDTFFEDQGGYIKFATGLLTTKTSMPPVLHRHKDEKSRPPFVWRGGEPPECYPGLIKK